MKRKSWFAVGLAVFAMGVGAAHASTTSPLISDEEFTVGQGDISTEFMINPQFFRGDLSDDWFQIRLGANYFITDIFAPGVEFEVNHINGTEARFLPNLKVYWPLNRRILPYAMIGIGYLHVPGADLFNFAVGPGVDFMLSSNVGVGIQLRYDLGTGSGTYHEIQFPIGFKIYFKI